MADKFGEFGDSQTPSPTPTPVKIPNAPNLDINKFGSFGLEPRGNINLGPEGEGEFQRQVKEGGKELGRNVINYGLPLTLGAIGGLAGPGGAAVGASTGALMAHTLTKGETLTPGEALKDIAYTAPSTYVGGKLLGPIENRLLQAIVGAVYQRGVKGVESAVQGEPIFDKSAGGEVGDFAKDFGLNLGFNIVGGKVISKAAGSNKETGEPLKQVLAQTREQTISPGPPQAEGVPARSTAEYGAGAQKAIRGNFAKAAQIEKAAFDNFRTNHVEPNTETLSKVVGFDQVPNLDIHAPIDPATGKPKPKLVPKIEEVKVKGPIYTANTQALAQEVLPELEGFMKGEVYEKLPPVSQGKYIKLYTTVKDLATPFTSVDSQGNPVEIPIKEWETVKDVRTDINQALGGKPGPNYPEAGLKKLAATLGDDIDNSIQHFWRSGPDATKALAIANKATEFKKQVFNKEIQTRLYGKYETGKMDTRVEQDPSLAFQGAYKSPEQAQRLKTALGPENEGFMKGDYVDNFLMAKAFGPNFSKFKPDVIINELENPNSSSRVILSAEERNNILRFARAARSMGEEASGGSLSFNKGRFVLNLGLGASRLITGSTTVGRVVIGGKQLFEAVQQSKVNAELASRLIKARPESFEAQQNVKLLMRGLRGSEVTFVTPKGDERKGTVNEAGKIVMLGVE